ncbi:MAG: DUF2961 domain-containing protein, partial [Tannerella sp.]|nr:DUF2961 domain-containing protein [Tannerella sp.]
LENHDEQRIASDFFAGNARAGLPGLWVAALINTNPVMIYNGQELGERGMDAEGFSGMDGRTSIFDYWSMASVRQWLTGQALKPEQNALRETYLRLLNMAAKEPVFTKGAFHDLMYANLSQPGFDPNKQYAFLRKWRDEAVLVAVNFDEQARDVRVQIPAQAFKALGIADNSPARTTDLQTGQTNMGTLTASWPYRLQLPPKGGRAIKFKFLQSLCLCLLTLCLLGSCRRGKAPDVTWAGLLKEMATPEKAAVWPDIPYRTYAKSGETKGLLFDQSGPGVITRLELADGAPKDGKLDFFFDKAEKPALSLDASDWTKMRPALPKAFLGPGTLLFPIPFNRQCRIVYEAPSGASPLRYQIDYRLYSRKRVETFSQDGLDDLKKQIARTAKQLTSPDSMAKPKSRIIQGNVTLRGGMPAVVTLPQGGMAVYELCVRLTPMEGSYQQAMRDLTLQGIFDGLITFRAPLAEFSGGGMGGYPVKTFYLEADGQGEVVSRWFMPYRETAELAFINEGVNQQHIRYSIRLVPIRWTPDLLYFHASWKEKLNVPLRKAPATALPWAFAVIRGGKGIYKGDVLSLYNHSNGWFGKGQMQIWVDQDPDLSPSEDCASLAAYYDLGSLPPKAGQNAFGGLVRYGLADSYGYNTLLRLRNLDNIPFRDSLRIGLRWLGQTSGQVDCSTTVFWYGDNKAQAAVTTRAETTARQLPPSPADETEQ